MNKIATTFPKGKIDQSFSPAFGLRNAHSQTILSSVGPRKRLIANRFKKHSARQQSMLLNGGSGVRLEGYFNQSSESRSDRLAILIHGWEGCHDSTYMQSMAHELLRTGVDVFRLNLRDHGDTHHLNREIFNSTLIDEVVMAIEDLQSRLSHPKQHLVGFSLGGNFSLRVAALAHGHQVKLENVIAFCPVVHASSSNVVLNQTSNYVYGKYFVRKWKRSLRKKLVHWPEYNYASELESMKTLDEMNHRLIPKYTAFDDLDTYFDAYAISGDRLADTIAPCHLYFAEDDMIIPVEDINDLADNPNLHITVTRRGGHCGYIKNWKWDCWQDEQVVALINDR